LGSACSALPCAGLQRRSERLQGGYQHIDTATVYGEEADVAAGIRASGLDPAQVFITTKLGNGNHSYVSSLKAFEQPQSSRRRRD
jgi:2,5-diketo-D-gluconate reductase A